MIKIDRYNIFRRDRHARCRGGVATFVRSEYDAIEVPVDGDTRTLELLWVRVMMPRGPVLIIIIIRTLNAHRSPMSHLFLTR